MCDVCECMYSMDQPTLTFGDKSPSKTMYTVGLIVAVAYSVTNLKNIVQHQLFCQKKSLQGCELTMKDHHLTCREIEASLGISVYKEFHKHLVVKMICLY